MNIAIFPALLTTLSNFSGSFATNGCHSKVLMTCEPPDAWGVLVMGFTGYAGQCDCRFLIELVCHRCDTDTAEVASAR